MQIRNCLEAFFVCIQRLEINFLKKKTAFSKDVYNLNSVTATYYNTINLIFTVKASCMPVMCAM